MILTEREVAVLREYVAEPGDALTHMESHTIMDSHEELRAALFRCHMESVLRSDPDAHLDIIEDTAARALGLPLPDSAK